MIYQEDQAQNPLVLSIVNSFLFIVIFFDSLELIFSEPWSAYANVELKL